MKKILHNLFRRFGLGKPEPKKSKGYYSNDEWEIAYTEYLEASRALRQAEVLFSMTSPDKQEIDIAVAELNMAYMRRETALKRMRMLAGIEERDEVTA